MEGTITSPRYPEQYPNTLDCHYVLKSPERSTITIMFDDFNVEAEEDCEYDFLSVSCVISIVAYYSVLCA